VARSAILEPYVIGIHIIHFRPQEVAYHRSVALAVDDYGNARFILEEVRTDDSARPKSAPNSEISATPEIINKVHDIILTNRRVKVRDLVETTGTWQWFQFCMNNWV